MTFAEIERLKAELTDRTVEVDPAVPELRRFRGLTGTVKTVNMNGYTLVQFDHPVDISWYDIHPSYLRLVDRKSKAEKNSEKLAVKVVTSAVAPAKTAASATPPPTSGDKPLTKLEMARMQAKAAAGASGTVSPAVVDHPTTAPVPSPAAGGKPISKLEMARLQGAMKTGGLAAPKSVDSPTESSAPAAVSPPHAESVPAKSANSVAASKLDESGKPLSKLEMARRQGAAKK